METAAIAGGMRGAALEIVLRNWSGFQRYSICKLLRSITKEAYAPDYACSTTQEKINRGKDLSDLSHWAGGGTS